MKAGKEKGIGKKKGGKKKRNKKKEEKYDDDGKERNASECRMKEKMRK